MKKLKSQISKLKTDKGFTLLELLIYIGIIAIVLTLLASLVFNLVQAREKNKVLTEVSQNVRLVLEKISSSVRNAQSINFISGSTLRLTMFDPNIDPTIFSLSPAGVVQIKQGPGPAQDLTSDKVNVRSLTFTQINSPDPAKPATVVCQIEIEYKSPPTGAQAKTAAQTTASLRQ